MRHSISSETVHEAYRLSKEVYERKIKQKDAIASLDMNHTSAAVYIGNFKRMREGRPYHRAFSNYSTNYYLEAIFKDYGRQGLEKALCALKGHYQYNKSAGNKPKELYDKFCKILDAYELSQSESFLPEEVPLLAILKEGATRQVTINAYERNPKARRNCIEHYGAICCVCSFDFEKVYGEIGNGYIHIHHLVEISTIGIEYEVDPIRDLRPVCPNCHSMLHQKKPAYTPEELKNIIRSR